jgi:hypothetical protein
MLATGASVAHPEPLASAQGVDFTRLETLAGIVHLLRRRSNKETTSMKKTRLSTLAALIIAATAAFAQGPRGTQHQNTPNRPAAAPDMTKARTVSGTVSAVDIGYGMQYPSITVNQSVIKVAPVWFLVEQNFESQGRGPGQRSRCALDGSR